MRTAAPALPRIVPALTALTALTALASHTGAQATPAVPPAATIGAPKDARRDAATDPRRWSFVLGLGAGRANVRADQGGDGPRTVLTLDLRVARALGDRARVGIQLAGWGFEATDVNDPAQGEGLSTVGPFVAFTPVASMPLSFDASYGHASYWNNRPDGWGGRGSGWGVGAAWDLVRRESFAVVLGVRSSAGRVADVRNAAVTLTGRRYRTADAQLRASVRLGRRRPR